MPSIVSAVVLLLLGLQSPENFEVRVSGGRVTILARAAPLADILDRLARQTGMKVVYDGPPPRERVSANIEGASQAAAVLSLMEGRGISYVLSMGPNRNDIETLIIVNARAGASPAQARPSSGPPPLARPPVLMIVPEPSSDPAPPEAEVPGEPVDVAPPFVLPLASYPDPPDANSRN